MGDLLLRGLWEGRPSHAPAGSRLIRQTDLTRKRLCFLFDSNRLRNWRSSGCTWYSVLSTTSAHSLISVPSHYVGSHCGLGAIQFLGSLFPPGTHALTGSFLIVGTHYDYDSRSIRCSRSSADRSLFLVLADRT